MEGLGEDPERGSRDGVWKSTRGAGMVGRSIVTRMQMQVHGHTYANAYSFSYVCRFMFRRMQMQVHVHAYANTYSCSNVCARRFIFTRIICISIAE